ncbi:Fic family protein [Reyranella sp. CPCC 100927]|nr:Fic family protein [Reyranella sp. CPCC 100927]
MRRDDLCHAVRQRLKRLPAPYAAHYGVVPLPPPEEAIAVGGAQQRHQAASEALARVDTLASELEDPYLISRVLTRREAVSSSSIEGTNSTLDELLIVEEMDNRDASEAAIQVRDYACALDDLLPRAKAQGHRLFDMELVRMLHRAVMRGDSSYQDVPGEFRRIVVWIGGRGDIAYSTYNPTPPDDISVCLAQTMTYMQSDGMHVMTQSLITRMAVAHVHFEAVHPFRDGNGRVGRLLLPLMMAAEGHVPLYLSPYIEAHRQAYYDALKEAQQQLEWPSAIGFISDAITGTVRELLATRDALRKLQEIWQTRRVFRARSAAARSLALLPHYPVVTVKRLAALLGITITAATAGIEQLVGARILEERTGHRRNRIFAAPEALSIINRPFGAEPNLPGFQA